MKNVKVILIAVLIIGISILHLQTGHAKYGLHILHRELFFIPIILTSFWFGLRIGLAAAILICIVYTPLVAGGGEHHASTTLPLIVAQLFMYLIIAILIGWLSDRKQMQQNKLLSGERATALARAASTISFEIKDVVKSLDQIHRRAAGLKNPEEEHNFQKELDRLNHLLEVLVRYVPEEEQTPLSTDLNQLLRASYKKYYEPAKKAGVEFVLEEDGAGCPSMIVSQSLGKVLDSLVENALDVTERGKKIHLSSKRGGSTCYLQVTDEGMGVTEEERKKLFTPFFTTKVQGSGLALAAGRKVLRDQGGDLVYIPRPEGGSTFRMIVPRENIQQNIDEFVREQPPPSDK